MFDFSEKGRAGTEERKWEMTEGSVFLERQMRRLKRVAGRKTE